MAEGYIRGVFRSSLGLAQDDRVRQFGNSIKHFQERCKRNGALTVLEEADEILVRTPCTSMAQDAGSGSFDSPPLLRRGVSLRMTGLHSVFLIFVFAAGMVCAGQQESLSAELKGAALHDAACMQPSAAQDVDAEKKDADVQKRDVDAQKKDEPALAALPIRAGGREVGTIIEVQGACHCQSSNCDTLVYLRGSEGYRLALREKYVSLHPMKIVKRGMPSLTGQFALSGSKMETTVYDWDGRTYRPSLCATVIKHGKTPWIARHACKAPAH
jgi:hypothetical protein